MSEFHFLRPAWLLMLLPALALLIALWRQQAQGNGWQRLIPAALLQPLLERSTAPRRTPLLLLGCAWLLATLALAGPTWQRLPQPLFQPQSALVVLLDLSPSMNAADLKPSRLVQARLRLIDLLRERREGQTALIVYAGDAHVVTPLSNDRQTLLALVSTLSPAIMPVRGSQVETAVARALELLRRSGHQEGELLLITDGVTAGAATAVQQQLAGSPYRLSILGVGSAEGAPIPLSDGSFAQDRSGATVLARLDSPPLDALARDSGGIYRTLTPGGRELADFSAQFAPRRSTSDPAREPALDQEFDQWQEAGPWLLLIVLPLAALGFRRGWLLGWVLLLGLPLGAPPPA
ncbi:MAG TPA: VWA domain-containing protein, partial [Motiliproteus sp.]